MPNKELLQELINRLYDFDAGYCGNEPATLADFTGYLNAQLAQPFASGHGTPTPVPGELVPPLDMRRIEGPEESWINEQYSDPVHEIPILVLLMYRYARHYVKKALKDSVLQTAEEFGFLITLMTHESMTKTELINTAVMEKTSGTEVIKRLLREGLIRAFADPDDKRSVRVAITPRGREEITKLLPVMSAVSKIVVGNLSESEINTLAYLLKKLDFFHHDLYMNQRNAGLGELVGAVIS
jgi:DNA-binding MarR family transcriptional regulator